MLNLSEIDHLMMKSITRHGRPRKPATVTKEVGRSQSSQSIDKSNVTNFLTTEKRQGQHYIGNLP
jgi:hypothetical protein